MSDEPVPYLVDRGWQFADGIQGPHVTYRLLTYPDGTVRFEHRCDRGDAGTIICAPAIHLPPAHPSHTVQYDDLGQPSVKPSIHCPDCGTHGFITEGRWAP